MVLRDLIADIQEGTLGGESYVLTLENGGIEMEVSEFTGLDEETLATVEDTIASLTEGIISGDIVPLPSAEATPEATPAS